MEVVSSSMQAYLSGDNEGALSHYATDVEFDATLRPEGKVYRGRDGVAEAMRVWTGTWADYKLQVEEIIDAGDHVILVTKESGRGKGSGIPIDQRIFGVFTLSEGRIVRWEGFLDRNQAFEAAGLEE